MSIYADVQDVPFFGTCPHADYGFVSFHCGMFLGEGLTMPGQQIHQSQAAYTLSQKALGIGEDHDTPEGRAFAFMLMKDNRVRALFLEEDLDLVRERAKDALGASGSGNLQQTIVQAVEGPLNARQTVPLSKLVKYAYSRKIAVYLIDSENVSYTKRRDIMIKRDQHAAKRFEDIVSQKLGNIRAGCLILFGALHFQGPTRGGGFREAKIPQRREVSGGPSGSRLCDCGQDAAVYPECLLTMMLRVRCGPSAVASDYGQPIPPGFGECYICFDARVLSRNGHIATRYLRRFVDNSASIPRFGW